MVTARVVAILAGVVLAAGLAGCEYAPDGGEGVRSSGTSPSAPTFVAPGSTNSADSAEEALQRDHIAEVEKQLGPESAGRVTSSLGGMSAAKGMALTGNVPKDGTYLIRAACSRGPAAELSFHQGESTLLELTFLCGDPFSIPLRLAGGPFAARLTPRVSGTVSIGSIRLEETALAPLPPVADIEGKGTDALLGLLPPGAIRSSG